MRINCYIEIDKQDLISQYNFTEDECEIFIENLKPFEKSVTSQVEKFVLDKILNFSELKKEIK